MTSLCDVKKRALIEINHFNQRKETVPAEENKLEETFFETFLSILDK